MRNSSSVRSKSQFSQHEKSTRVDLSVFRSRTQFARQSAPRRGAALVEFAIAAPIAFLLFFAAIDFCRLSMLTHTAEQAAYEGARRASIPGATAKLAKQAAQSELDRLGVRQATVNVTPGTITSATESVTVEVIVPLTNNAWVSPQVLHNAVIRRKSTLSREYVASE